jgi:hypothetical protein
MQLMKTDKPNQSAAVFFQMVSVALAQLKQRLQQDYEQVYPDLRQLIDLVLEQEEARAWDLTVFPHLLLPDLVEAHLASLNMQPVGPRHHAREQHEVQTYQSAFAVCG